jgi:hypothetical protein
LGAQPELLPSGPSRVSLHGQLVGRAPAGGDHGGDLREGVPDLLLLDDEGRMVEGDQRPPAPDALLAVGDQHRHR